ncbi:MAG: phenylalanine--tRNA ligase subunit alpha, partial [Thermoplasmataceae archaeon]
LGDEGRRYAKIGLPELRVFQYIISDPGATVESVRERFGESETGIALSQLAKLGVKPSGGSVFSIPPQKINEIKNVLGERQRLLQAMSQGEAIRDRRSIEYFLRRGNLIVSRKHINRLVRINENGKASIKYIKESGTIGKVTPEILASGIWRKEGFRRYDLNAPVSARVSAVAHPLRQLMDRIHEIFLSFGFREMSGHYIESAFWNMDALFIPQDHPAREMQDTFYLEGPDMEIEHPEVIEAVKRAHEKGIRGYRGWEYAWSLDKARKPLLRTHTTVSTIRTLYELGQCPVGVFSIEKVFRHESVDWKHLAELHQIEGAYYAKDANLSTLKWLMKEFYGRLGFSDIHLIPSYYPYTEPSMDVVATINGKEIELGGSGIFRPEVTKPLGLHEPVIAWGLGLERLAMLFYGLDDIRKIYRSDLDWLRNFPMK